MSRRSDSNLKKLSRQELLEMLIAEEKRIEQLEAELEAARAALKDRTIKIENSGSIAEAALKLSGVFEAAQAAADLYMENMGMQGGQSMNAGGENREHEEKADTSRSSAS